MDSGLSAAARVERSCRSSSVSALLPNPVSRRVHPLPRWFHRGEVLGNHFAQPVVPFFLFAPQPVASTAAAIMILTRLWLVFSGNFAWLNVITIVLAFSAMGDGTAHAGSVELLDSVANGRADVALVVETGNTPAGVQLRELSRQKLVVLCHRDHPFAARTEVDLHSLRTESLIGFQPGWGAQILAHRAFAAAGFGYRAAMEVNDVHPLLDLLGYNLGVAIVPASFAHKRPDVLTAVPLPADMPEWIVTVAVADEPSPAAMAFLAQLSEDVTISTAHASTSSASENDQAASSLASSSSDSVTSAA